MLASWGLKVDDSGFRVQDLRLRVLMVYGSGLGIYGLTFRV